MPNLTKEQLNHFKEFGFLKVENLIDPEKIIDPIIDEYHTVLNNLAEKLFDEGKISSKYEDLDFGERVTRIYAESGEVYNQFIDFSLPQTGIKEDTPFWAGPAVFNALKDDNLLDAVESIIGHEIFSNPIQHVRIKVPESEAPKDENGLVKFGATPWHQDAGVATEEVDNTNMLTVWFPLMDASEENGCLEFIPGSHRKKETLNHYTDNNPNYTLNQELKKSCYNPNKSISLCLKAGQMSIHDVYLVHGSKENKSKKSRRGMTMRFMPTTSYFDRSFAKQISLDTGIDHRERTLFLMSGIDKSGKNDFRIRM